MLRVTHLAGGPGCYSNTYDSRYRQAEASLIAGLTKTVASFGLSYGSRSVFISIDQPSKADCKQTQILLGKGKMNVDDFPIWKY